MSSRESTRIAPAEGKLGVLIPGIGAVSTIQLMKLKNTLRWMRGEDLITHLGLEYYD